MQKYFILLFILLSFITQPFAEPGTHPILSRVTLPDVFGALALIFGLNQLFKSFKSASNISSIYRNGFFMLLCFFLPILFSLQPDNTLREILIITFLLFISVIIFFEFKDKFLTKLLPLIMYTSILATVLGIYDAFASTSGLPRIFPSRAVGEVLSGFRNGGQAGAYFLIFITILFPLKNSKLHSNLSKYHRKLLTVALVCCFVFILLTGKIAAYLGLLAGVILFIIMKRRAKSLISLLIFGILLFFVFINLESIAPDVHNRITMKYDSRIDQRFQSDFDSEGDFVAVNFGAAINAFEDRPLIGSGLAAIVGIYHTHEVHSTYFKILGETGLIGLFGYLLFMYAFIKLFNIRKFKNTNPYADYLNSMLPFIIGCLISWGYTYHLRKREFWILVAVILIAHYNFYKYQNKLNT